METLLGTALKELSMKRLWGIVIGLALAGCGGGSENVRADGTGGASVSEAAGGGSQEPGAGGAQLARETGGATSTGAGGVSPAGGAAAGGAAVTSAGGSTEPAGGAGSAMVAAGGAGPIAGGAGGTSGTQPGAGGSSVAAGGGPEGTGGSLDGDAGLPHGAGGVAGAPEAPDAGEACSCRSGACCDGCRPKAFGALCGEVITSSTCDRFGARSDKYANVFCSGTSALCDGHQAYSHVLYYPHACGDGGM